MNLTDIAVKQAKAKPYKFSDGEGMYLLVTPKGQKWWRFDYRLNGKRYTLSLGVYDDVSLKTARERRREARELRATMRGEGKRRKTRNLDMLGLILRNGSGSHGDARKEQNKKLGRKKVSQDDY